MALFHLNVTQIKRSKGQSAIAAAAYRAGEKLYSEYYGETSDYTKKHGVICSEILLPDHAPREYADRQTLWNAVEKAERGKNAQLAYSFDIALQNEFSLDENIALARQFLLEHFVSRGMVVDFAIHVPDAEPGGISNPHFHVMAPIRPIEANGKWGMKQCRVYELDDDGNRILDADGNYVFNAVPTTDWGSPETLEHWREQWASMCNAKFEEKGLPERIDHRSYERQGIDLLPTIHEGPSVRQMESKGIRTDKGEFNRWIKSTNSVIRDIKKKTAALLNWLKEVKDEFSKPKAPDLITLLHLYFDQRNAGAYSQRAKVSNLKEYSELTQYLLDHDIHDLETLEPYNTALYYRLSRDDENFGDSVSIETQRTILQKYARDNGFHVVDEYIDDGWSGTNFDRPDFQRMMADVDAGKINCIITKDLSRFGREHVMMDYYLEFVFPEKKIRYIAVTENEDTEKGLSDFVPFKNLFNEWFAKDTSRKVKAAFHAKHAAGQRICTYAPLGYKKHPEIKNALIIDEETRWIIEKIFDLAVHGAGAAKIARALVIEKVPTASWLNFQRYGTFAHVFENAGEEKAYAWTIAQVKCILKDETYIGNSVHGKQTNISYKNKKRVRKAETEWFRVENTHEAIISREVFEKVQEQIASRRRQMKDSTTQIFAGLVRCADCGWSMSFATNKQNKNANPKELTAELLNTLIEKIVIHEAVKGEGGMRDQEIEIFYRFVGKIE